MRRAVPLATTVFATAALVAAVSPARALDCSLAAGVYTPVDADDDWSAEEGRPNSWEITHVVRSDDASDRPWVIRLTEHRQKLFAEFAVAHPPGFGGAHVFMVRRPKPGGRAPVKRFGVTGAPSATLYYFGDDLKRVDPESGPATKAPPLLQLPGLSKAFWDWKRDGRRFVPPDGLWKLSACRG